MLPSELGSLMDSSLMMAESGISPSLLMLMGDVGDLGI
jgi:hypothetical protein